MTFILNYGRNTVRYYILNYTTETSSTHGNDYYHVNICNEDLEEFWTYVYPFQKNGKKIHNAATWLNILQCKEGVVISNLKSMPNKKHLINADSIRQAQPEQLFATKQDMYDHISDLIHKRDVEKLEKHFDNGLV